MKKLDFAVIISLIVAIILSFSIKQISGWSFEANGLINIVVYVILWWIIAGIILAWLVAVIVLLILMKDIRISLVSLSVSSLVIGIGLYIGGNKEFLISPGLTLVFSIAFMFVFALFTLINRNTWRIA